MGVDGPWDAGASFSFWLETGEGGEVGEVLGRVGGVDDFPEEAGEEGGVDEVELLPAAADESLLEDGGSFSSGLTFEAGDLSLDGDLSHAFFDDHVDDNGDGDSGAGAAVEDAGVAGSGTGPEAATAVVVSLSPLSLLTPVDDFLLPLPAVGDIVVLPCCCCCCCCEAAGLAEVESLLACAVVLPVPFASAALF